MKNSLKHISLFLFVLAMSIGSGYATNAAGTYTLVKGDNNSTYLESGQYVIGYVSTNMRGTPAFSGAGAQNLKGDLINSYMTGSYYALDDVCTLILNGSEGVCEWTITNDGYDSYTIYDGTYYMCAKSENKNKLWASTTTTSQNATWTITHNKGVSYTACTVENEAEVDYGRLANSSETLSGYGSGTPSKIYFFKKTADLYDINKEPDAGTNTMDAKVNGISVTRAAAGATVTLSQTANPNYCFDSWIVEDEDGNAVPVTNNSFTMPAKDVTVYPTYTGCSTDATITAASSESISQTTATVRCAGGISSKGDACCTITEYGFVISAKSANENPAIGGSGVTKHQSGTSYSTLNTAFSKALTGLTASTTYCVRAYATNGHGTAYSTVHEFTTAAEVVFGNYIITCNDHHTVTYNKNTTTDITGTLPTDDNEYSAGQTVYVSSGTISRTGYDFVGWNTDKDATEGITEFVMGASDVTIYAIWAPVNYTLTMATTVGGAAGSVATNASIAAPRTGAGDVANKHYGEEITVTVVAPAHHTFTGWTSSNGGTFADASALSTTFTMPAGNTTVTAAFTEDTKYTVTWSDNGETEDEAVYTGETTVFPVLEGCDMYVAAGWILDDGTFTEETTTKPAGTIYAVGAATPSVSGNVTYKAVYRHKYYTTDEFVLNTTTAGGYYLSVNPGTVRYSGAKSGSKLSTVTDKLTAVPVYVEKEADGQYSFKLVGAADEQYIVGSNSTDFGWQNTKTGDYKWTVTDGAQGKGDYHILNAGTNNTRGIIYNNGNGNYIGNYAGSNVTSTAYYDMNFVPGYYYKYSPTKACYVITVASNNWSAGEFKTIDPSTKVLDGTMLTVKVACGKTISSWSFTSGTATLVSGENPEYIGMEGDKEVYRFTIIPTSDVTLKVNFGNGAQRTIIFLDGSTVLGQTKTAAITDKRDCDSYTLPVGYNTASGDGGACADWTFDGWTATNYTYGQMVAPEGIVAAGTSEDVHGDATWYAVYHKTFAAGAYFKLKYDTKYVSGYSSNQFTTSETEADGLMFGLENDYLYYIDKTTRGKKWVYYQSGLVVDDSKPTSNTYKTTITANGGTYEVKCNGHWLEQNGSGKVVFYASTEAARRPTRPDAAGFTAYYPKTDCAIEYVTVTYDAGAGNSCTSAGAEVESNTTITLPVEADITYDKSDWTFAGWSASAVQSVVPAAPSDLILGGGSYMVTGNVTLHAVYSQTPPDGTFDNTKGGRFIIWAEDGGMNYYAKSNGQTKGKLDVTLACSEAAVFEFVEAGTAGQYKIHIVGEEKFMKGEGCADAQTDFEYDLAGAAPVWTVSATATEGVWKVVNNDCGNRGFVFAASGVHKFGHYASQNTLTDAYKDIHIGQCDDYYTTNPNKTLSVTGDVKVTSTSGCMVMAKDQLLVNASNIGAGAPVIITSGSSDVYFSTTREVNISKADKPKTSITINADGSGNIESSTIYVHYMPTVATDGIENVQVVVSSPEMSVKIPVKVRHLPATFAIAAKVGTNWYALTGNMNGAKTPKAIQIEVDESTWTAYAPDTCAYRLWPVKTTNAGGDRYQTHGEKVRFSAVNNATAANGGLWANNSSSSNTINNSAAITAIGSDPDEAYEWKIAATEAGSTWKYTLQMNQSQNINKLNIHRAADLVWGTYSEGQAVTGDIYLLPISEITPFDFKVVEWYPTKVLLQTDAALASPAVRVNGEEVAAPVLTNKGGKLWEISGLPLQSNPARLMSITYTAADVTYKGIKTVPVIISRTMQNVTAEPFFSLTRDVYSYTDLVVRDGAVLTMDGVDAANRFYDVTIYPTAKISVPEGKKLGVHSLTFFGGIDEIYDGSAYTVNKYGVPELSLKGSFGTKTVTTIDYVMRVDLDQMYQTAVPYDVNLADITYWDGTVMTPGTNLYVSAYDGQARANRESKTWVWEENFERRFGEAKLKAGIGYTISAELQSGVGSEYSIIRMPMKNNVAANSTEAEKTVHVTAYDNNKSATITDNHKGWNYLSNPYMVSISGAEADTKLAVGYLRETGTGPWEWVNDTYRYVTIPHDDGTDYYQQKFSTATLKPFKSFFLQIATEGDLSFALASRQNMPARYLQTEESEVEFEVLFSSSTRTDNTGLLIAGEYTSAYEVNADLEKMVGSMAVYTIYGGYNLAYNALSPAEAEQMIPVGYVAPEAGDYNFALDENGDYGQIEHIYLTDFEQSRKVDLLDGGYAFKAEAGKNEKRFAFNIILKKEAPEIITGTDNVDDEEGLPVKFVYRGKMYILNKGVLYDATGKKVKETNKL